MPVSAPVNQTPQVPSVSRSGNQCSDLNNDWTSYSSLCHSRSGRLVLDQKSSFGGTPKESMISFWMFSASWTIYGCLPSNKKCKNVSSLQGLVLEARDLCDFFALLCKKVIIYCRYVRNSHDGTFPSTPDRKFTPKAVILWWTFQSWLTSVADKSFPFHWRVHLPSHPF